MEKAAIVRMVVAVLLLMGCAVESVSEMGGYSGGGVKSKSSHCVSCGSLLWDEYDHYCYHSDDYYDYCDVYGPSGGMSKISNSVSSGSRDDYSPSGDNFQSRGKSNSSDSVLRGSQSKLAHFVYFVIFSLIMVSIGISIALTENTVSMLKLQVVFKGPTHIQRELDLISEIVDASTHKGLCSMLSETSSRLLLRIDRCFSAHSSVNKKCYILKTPKKCFDQICAEERNILDGVTPLHVCNIREMSDSSHGMDRSNNEFIAVTIVVAAIGAHRLPDINCHSDLENALQYLKSIHHADIEAVKVLWTPPDKDDMQSEKKLFEDYALLASMKYYKN